MLTSRDTHVGQLLCVLIHAANWLDVFLYNELYPPQNGK